MAEQVGPVTCAEVLDMFMRISSNAKTEDVGKVKAALELVNAVCPPDQAKGMITGPDSTDPDETDELENCQKEVQVWQTAFFLLLNGAGDALRSSWRK